MKVANSPIHLQNLPTITDLCNDADSVVIGVDENDDPADRDGCSSAISYDSLEQSIASESSPTTTTEAKENDLDLYVSSISPPHRAAVISSSPIRRSTNRPR